MGNELNIILRELYEALDTEGDGNKQSFNLFTVLGVEHKEVIICRFLGEMLDPRGSHGLGAYPLYSFVREVLGHRDFTEEEAARSEVVLEECITGDRRVDIVIHAESHVFPIEAKIDSGDRDSQLYDYYKYFFGKDPEKQIYYLTPEGRMPSEVSRGALSELNVIPLSFSGHIRHWLEGVIKERGSENAGVKLVLGQFLEIISERGNSQMTRDAIVRTLGLDRGIDYTDELRGAVALLQHSNAIYDMIRVNYLKDNLILGDRFSLRDCTDEDRRKDSNALLKVMTVHNGKEKTAAWICVQKNLYIVCEKTKEGCGWKRSHDTYFWKYIKPEGYRGKEYNMTDRWDVRSIKKDPIDISRILETVDLQ